MASKGQKGKGELSRLALICTAIDVFYQPTKEKIREFVAKKQSSDKMSGYVCTSQIEKDIHTLRNEFGAPIVYSKISRGYSFEDKDFKFWKCFLAYMSEYITFPKEINKIIFDE